MEPQGKIQSRVPPVSLLRCLTEWTVVLILSAGYSVYLTYAFIEMRGPGFVTNFEYSFHTKIVSNAQIAPYQYRPLMSYIVVGFGYVIGDWMYAALALKWLVHVGLFTCFYWLCRHYLSFVWAQVAIAVLAAALPQTFAFAGMDYYQFVDAALTCVACGCIERKKVATASAVIIIGMLNKETIGVCGLLCFFCAIDMRTRWHYAIVTTVLCAAVYLGLRLFFGVDRPYSEFVGSRTPWEVFVFNVTNWQTYVNLAGLFGSGTFLLAPLAAWALQPPLLRRSVVYLSLVYVPICACMTLMREPRQFLVIFVLLVIMTINAMAYLWGGERLKVRTNRRGVDPK